MKPQPGPSTREALAGLVERVTYHYEEDRSTLEKGAMNYIKIFLAAACILRLWLRLARARDDPWQLEGFRFTATSHEDLQALDRSTLRREGARYHRAQPDFTLGQWTLFWWPSAQT